MRFNEKFEYYVRLAYMHVIDALLGYPKEYTVYPKAEYKTIRYLDGLWTLRPVYTYNKRALSFIKHNYRYGWSVVNAPESQKKFEGRDNLTEDPGMAVINMVAGEELLENYRNSTFTP